MKDCFTVRDLARAMNIETELDFVSQGVLRALEANDIIEQTYDKLRQPMGRPATLYRFKKGGAERLRAMFDALVSR